MATAHRLTVYRPRSASTGGDTTALTPPSGAIHSDNFQVADVDGVTGYEPYLHKVDGSFGRFDPLDKTYSTGQYTVELLDFRSTSPKDNAERWVTAFLASELTPDEQRWADGYGVDPLPGCRVVIERSLDFDPGSPGSATWNTFFTGRITADGLQTRIKIRFDVRDGGENMKEKIFGSRPHSSITYTQWLPLLPLGLLEDYGPFEGGGWLSGTLESHDSICASPAVIRIAIDLSDMEDKYGPNANIITRAWPNIEGSGDNLKLDIDARLRVRVRFTSGARTDEEGEQYFFCGAGFRRDGEGHWHLEAVPIQNTDYNPLTFGFNLSSDPDSIDIDSTDVGETVDFYVYQRYKEEDERWHYWNWGTISGGGEFYSPYSFAMAERQISKERPLLINDINAVTLWGDFLDGDFSFLSPTDGSTTWSQARDTSAFAALVTTLDNDANAPLCRLRVEDQANVNSFVEEHLLRVWQLGYYLNEDDEVVPFDMRWTRFAADAGSAPTLTDADLLADSKPERDIDGAAAITEIQVKLYKDVMQSVEPDAIKDVVFPDVHPGRLEEKTWDLFITPIGRWRDLRRKPVKYDAKGLRIGVRAGADEESDEGDESSKIEQLEDAVLETFMTQRQGYGTAPTFYRVRCRRTTNVNNCRIGDLRIFNFSAIPNPSTAERGGQRIGMCIERQDPGSYVELSFIDLGRNSVASSPTVNSVSQNTWEPRHAVNVQVTPNASGDHVVVQYATTSTGTGTRPTSGWHHAFTHSFVSGSAIIKTIRGIAAGRRVWVRAATIANDDIDYLIPSSWAYNIEATEYTDLDAMPSAPTPSIGNISGLRAEASWTNTNSDLNIEAYLEASTCPGSPSSFQKFIVLPPGTEFLELAPLELSTTYCFSIRYADEISRGAVGNAQFNTTATPLTAPDAGWIEFMGKAIEQQWENKFKPDIDPTPRETYNVLGILAASRDFNIEVQFAVDSGGSPGTFWTFLQGERGPRVITHRAPRKAVGTGTRYWYRFRLYKVGYAAGAWSNQVLETDDYSIFALGALPPLPLYPIVTITQEQPPLEPENALIRMMSWPEHSDTAFYYAYLAYATAIPAQTDSSAWTEYTEATNLVRHSSELYKLAGWADLNSIWGPIAVVEIAADARAQITSGPTWTELVGVVVRSAYEPDLQTTGIRIYRRKGAWPTLTGTSDGTVDPDYLRTTIVGSSGWTFEDAGWTAAEVCYEVAIPIDVYGNAGPRATGNYTVTGTAVPAILNGWVQTYDADGTACSPSTNRRQVTLNWVTSGVTDVSHDMRIYYKVLGKETSWTLAGTDTSPVGSPSFQFYLPMYATSPPYGELIATRIRLDLWNGSSSDDLFEFDDDSIYVGEYCP